MANKRWRKAFVDPNAVSYAAYNTYWRDGVLLKLLQITGADWIDMLCDRKFQVILNETLANNVNLTTNSHKTYYRLCYTDAIGFSDKSFEYIEHTITSDINNCFKIWRLVSSPNKNEVSCCQLSNRRAKRELHVVFAGQPLKQPFPKKKHFF